MQRNKFSSSSKNSRLRRRLLRDAVIPHPPSYNSEAVIGMRIRYIADQGISNLEITDADLAGLIFIASTTTQSYPIYSPFKVRRVQIWSPMASDLTPVTCSLEFTKGDAHGGVSRSMLVSDTSMGATQCAYIDARPKPDSMAALYQYTSSNGFMRITCPTRSVIDLHITIVLSASASTTVITTSGLTVGRLYYGRLDGAGGHLVPTGGVLPAP
jgi:hypothetical protein